MEPRDRLIDELEQVFIEYRGETGARKFAERVFDRGQEPRLLLLGVFEDGVRAVYFHMGTEQVQAVHIHSGRLDGLNDIKRIRTDRGTKPWEFVYDRGADGWAWLHPGMRWVFQ